MRIVSILFLCSLACEVVFAVDQGETLIYAQNRLFKATPLSTNTYVSASGANDVSVTFSARKITAQDAIELLSVVGCRRYKLEKTGVIISEYGDEWPTKRQVFRVKPAFGDILGGSKTDDVLREYLDSIGFTFSQNHRAHYDASRSLLFVRFAPSECENLERYLGVLGVLETTLFPDPKPLTPKDVPWGEKLSIILPQVQFNQVPFAEAVVMLANMIRENDPAGVGFPIALKPFDFPSDARVLQPSDVAPASSVHGITSADVFTNLEGVAATETGNPDNVPENVGTNAPNSQR